MLFSASRSRVGNADGPLRLGWALAVNGESFASRSRVGSLRGGMMRNALRIGSRAAVGSVLRERPLSLRLLLDGGAEFLSGLRHTGGFGRD